MCQGLNSHYFHVIGDKLINPIVGVYIPIIRIPIKGGRTIPNIATFDHGTYDSMGFADSWGKNLPKVGANDPCPCGSGKKYKKCHGGRRIERIHLKDFLGENR